ncbi:MAG: flagellar biosynthesis anti-sigma factor FlgM [Endozoicomonas sp. (ex Botrylloides leachii)]|nr:flagellar biosynthesis anti-sigma factor FlgM [Endozoicomonas sp. (ex Botrylloides leachii)]
MSKVNRSGLTKTGAVSRTKDRSVKQRPESGSTGLKKEDFELSPEARHMDELFQKMVNIGDIDAARVASIKQALAKGGLPIDYQQLASKIFELSDEINNDKNQ